MPTLSHRLQGWLQARLADMRPVRAQIRRHETGVARSPSSERCCIFAHFDPHGIVDRHVIEYLRRIRDLGSDILFVTTGASLREQDIRQLKPICCNIVQRRNITADFGSWKLGIALFGNDIGRYRQLILANDSVYGPFRDLAPIFAVMEGRDLDLWGLTENFAFGRHVQSYFMVFERSAIRSDFFRKFWQELRNQWDKDRLIFDCEIGLSRLAREQGMKVASWISSENIGTEQNPTLFAWERLIEERNFPFLKTEILKLNRFQSPNAARWREILAKFPDYDPELIAAHLRRVGSVVEPG